MVNISRILKFFTNDLNDSLVLILYKKRYYDKMKCRIPNPGVLCSKALGSSMIESAFWELSGKI